MSKKRLVSAALLLLVGCIGGDLPPSVWPPPNFELVVEEFVSDGDRLHTVRRLHVDALGNVIYGTSSMPLVDEATGTSLPVFDRLAIYRLEPTCVRALSRKLDRLGIGRLDLPSVVLSDRVESALVVTWRAFDENRRLVSQGRLRGEMAEILAVVAGHLPPGESFDVPIGRPVVSVLRGVPEPRHSVEGALDAHRQLLGEHGEDPDLLLDAFALACRAGRRDQAEELLDAWERWREVQRTGFEDGPGLDAEVLRRLLPASD